MTHEETIDYILKRAYEHFQSKRSDKGDELMRSELKRSLCPNDWEQQVRQLRTALEWAENELDHDLDETGCCQKWCFSCIAIKNNKTWKQWRQKGYNPIRDALIATLPKKETL